MLQWSPEGKRLITGASTGEFTLWNGTAFNFETILQVHAHFFLIIHFHELVTGSIKKALEIRNFRKPINLYMKMPNLSMVLN